MTFRFKLIKGTLEYWVEEPVGFADIDLLLKRDPQWHGIYFEYGTKALTFSGEGADVIRSTYLADGLAADIKFLAEALCDGEWINFLDGRLNFGRLKYNCDEVCTVNIPVEQDTCMMKLRARWDTPVDLNSLEAIDGEPLTPYGLNLKKNIPVPPGGITLANHALVALEGDTHDIAGSPHLGSGLPGTQVLSVRPWYDRVQEQSLLGQLSNPVNEWVFGHTDANPMSPQALIDNETGCYHDLVNYRVRMKGSITIENFGSSVLQRTVGIGIYRTGWEFDRVLIDSFVISPLAGSPAGNETFLFDRTFTGTFSPVPIPFGLEKSNPFYAVVEVAVTYGSINVDFSWHFDPETEVDVNTVESCQATNANLYMVHESLSRVVESATNKCMKVRSEYYGRLDSMPYAYAGDGCGGMRAITNGKEVRQDTEATMKITPAQIFEGLLKIDCIGMGIETYGGEQVLRVEDFAHFYQDIELLYLDHVSGLVKEVMEEKHYNEIKIGYEKWDTGTVSCARNEYNGDRLYTTKFNQTKNPVDILSNLIAGFYALETARKAALAPADQRGATDFDDDNFIICLTHGLSAYEVEQGNIVSATNISAPSYAINYRLTPARNALRWWRILAAGYRDILAAFLKFTDGHGNAKASAALDSVTCRVETSTLEENEDIDNSDMIAYYQSPLWTPEKIIFEYPLSIPQYLQLKNNPNGYVRYQCGNGADEQGWLTDLKFNPSNGLAQFTLIAKR